MKENLDLLENKEDSDGFCGESRMRIFNLLGKVNPWGLQWRSEDETSLDPCWGIRETLEISTGNQTKENLDLLENKEDSDGFFRELRMRIFNLLGKFESLGTSS